MIDARKFSKEWMEKTRHLRKSLDLELLAIAKDPIEEINPDRRRRIRRLKAEIVDEALKYWS